MSTNLRSPQIIHRQSINGVYTMITREKERENDRERILKKFCFNHRSSSPFDDCSATKSHKKTLSETKYLKSQEKSIRSPSRTQMQIFPLKHHVNTRNKSAQNRNDHKVSTVNLRQSNLAGTTKEITGKTNRSSQNNSHYSEDTEKESKSHLRLMSNKISDEFKMNHYPGGINECNGGEEYEKVSNESLIEFNQTQCKRIERNNFLPLSDNSSVSSGNSRSSLSKRIKNSNDYLNQYSLGNNHCHLNQISGYNACSEKSRKMHQLFSFDPNYNISNRFTNDEINKKHLIEAKKQFKFIQDVKEDNEQLRKIKLIAFLKMSDYSIYNLLNFAYESFDAFVLNNNKYISTKVHLCLNSIFEGIVKGFKEHYSGVIQLEEFYFKQKTVKRLRSVCPIFDLVFRGKVITSECNKSYEFGYSYVRKRQ